MTHREKQLLDFIAHQLRETGCAPSFEEMAAHLGLASKSNVHRLVASLERQGRLVRPHGGVRAIELTNPLAAFTTEQLRAEIARREAAR